MAERIKLKQSVPKAKAKKEKVKRKKAEEEEEEASVGTSDRDTEVMGEARVWRFSGSTWYLKNKDDF